MDSTGSTPSNFPRTVSRACTSCARAKAKCVAGPESIGTCQRCHRLQKRCEPAPVLPRSQPRKRKQPSTDRVPKDQVKKLEQKIDGLATLLKATQPPPSSLGHVSAALCRAEVSTEQLEIMNSLRNSEVHKDAFSCSNIPALNAAQPLNNRPAQGLLNPFKDIQQYTGSCENFDRTLDKAGTPAILLQRFRDEMSPCFPFILLPPSLNADQLRQERPFLFSCIMAVSCHDTALQVQLGKHVIKQFAERMTVNCERSLDLLFGILIYAGWCNHHFFNIPQLTNLIASASTLLCDLGLNRPIPTAPPNRSLFEDAIRESSVARYLTMISSVRSLEEKRAFLGCFFLSSAMVAFFRKTPIVRYSPYVEECLQSLDEAGEHPNDQIAIALVRLQIIFERILESPWHDKVNFSGVSSSTIFIMNSLQGQLKQYRKDLPPALKGNVIILMHYHAAESALYELGLTKKQSQAINGGPQFRRPEVLYACLQANKSFWDNFFSMPLRNLFNFSIVTSSDFTNAMIVLQLLCTYNHPEWNLAEVREVLDFNKLLNHLKISLERVQYEPGCEDIDIFTKIAKKISYIEDFLATKLGVQSGDHASEPRDMQTLQITNTGDIPDLWDEAWLRDIFGPWDFQSSLGGGGGLE